MYAITFTTELTDQLLATSETETGDWPMDVVARVVGSDEFLFVANRDSHCVSVHPIGPGSAELGPAVLRVPAAGAAAIAFPSLAPPLPDGPGEVRPPWGSDGRTRV